MRIVSLSRTEKPGNRSRAFSIYIYGIQFTFLSFFLRRFAKDFNLAEKTFFTTIFNEKETEKLTTAPTNANIPVRIKSSEPITGKVAKTVPPQVPIMVEKDLKGIIRIFNLNPIWTPLYLHR